MYIRLCFLTCTSQPENLVHDNWFLMEVAEVLKCVATFVVFLWHSTVQTTVLVDALGKSPGK